MRTDLIAGFANTVTFALVTGCIGLQRRIEDCVAMCPSFAGSLDLADFVDHVIVTPRGHVGLCAEQQIILVVQCAPYAWSVTQRFRIQVSFATRVN